MIRSDNGLEFVQKDCKEMFVSLGIVHQENIPRNPQQNGRVEYRPIIKTARAMRIHASLPIKFWGECVLAVVHVINLLPSSVLQWKIPFELIFKKKADYDGLKELGCLCYGKPNQPSKKKLNFNPEMPVYWTPTWSKGLQAIWSYKSSIFCFYF